jgi:hypothetical protein
MPPYTNEAGDHHEQKAGPDAVDAEAVLRRAGHGIALEGIEADRERCDQADGIEDRQPFVFGAEPVDDRPRRPAAEIAVRLPPLEQLGQRAFDEAGGHAGQRDRPHPEHGARTAQCDRDGDAGDIAAADASADRNEQRLTPRDGLGIVSRALPQNPEHAPEEPKLHETGKCSDEHAENDEDRDQRPSPRQIPDDAKETL